MRHVVHIQVHTDSSPPQSVYLNVCEGDEVVFRVNDGKVCSLSIMGVTHTDDAN